ncbi:MAG TPA: hypothetical protein VGG74_21290 [Kofleriaceae bacterium]
MTTPRRSIVIGAYTIDASIREVHTYESEVTQFPVEQGSPIADNVRPKPITVQLEGVVSDTPLPPIAQGRDVVGSGQGDGDDSPPSVGALAALLAIRDAREPVTISTALKSYDNMALQNLEIPRDTTTGEALRFTATFVQIVIVTTTRALVRTTVARTARPGDSAAKNFGKHVGPNVAIVYVISLPANTIPSTVASYTRIYGPPVLQDSTGFHFRDVNPKTTPPDGYVAKNQYHALGSSASDTVPSDATGYDPGTNTWTNDQGLPVSAVPPPDVPDWTFPMK